MYRYVNGKKITLTEAEIAEVKQRELEHKLRLEAIEKESYKEKRKAAYPSIDELTVALWEQIVEGDNSMLQELQRKRNAVKAKHPKPKK